MWVAPEIRSPVYRLRVGRLCRLKGALSLLREKLPETQIVLLGLLPRDAHVLSGPPIFEWPNRMSNALALANSEFEVGSHTQPHNF